MNLQVCSSIQCKMADLCKTDLQKVISYLDEAAKIYDAFAHAEMQVPRLHDNSINKQIKIKTQS